MISRIMGWFTDPGQLLQGVVFVLPGILIGYISSINVDSNNLTKSGLITPAVDFEHLEEVLVITELKQTVGE